MTDTTRAETAAQAARIHEADRLHLEEMKALRRRLLAESDGKPTPPSLAWAAGDLSLYIARRTADLAAEQAKGAGDDYHPNSTLHP